MRGPKLPKLELSEDHVEVLQRNLRTGRVEQRVARRSRILLLRAEGMRRAHVAETVGCGRNTAWRIEKRYVEEGLDALEDRPRPGRPPKFSPLPASQDD